MEEQGKTYIMGFNQGFKLQQYSPELFEKLKSALSQNSEYERGILEGAAEYRRQMEKGRADDLNSLRESKGQEQDKDLSR